jgi:CDP-diacylglycerol--glycerol-3-phosphate 3-phosphatidyltransferase
MLRVVLVPFLVILLLIQERTASYVAAAIFVVGAATDGLDGYLARRHATVTRTGQWLDPLADKILVAAAVITLSALDELPAWAATIIVVREIGVSLLRAYLGMRGVAMPASRSAKIKTTLQLVAITLYILPLGSGADGTKLGFLIAAVAMTVITGIQYALDAGALLRAPRSGVPPASGVNP